MSAAHIEHTEVLATINQRIVAADESLPQVTLHDGTREQTGTVAAMLHYIARYNAGERGAVAEQLALAVPALLAVGLFDLFSSQEWILGDNPGRRFVGLKAQAYLSADREAADIQEH